MNCFECETVSDSGILTITGTKICLDCQEKHYLTCAVCKKAVPNEESVKIDENRLCLNCSAAGKSDAENLFDNQNIDELIAEYIELSAKEKELKSRSDEIKEILKSMAENEPRINNAVLFKSANGILKCSYRQNRKCDNEKVSLIKENIDSELFEILFKTEFKPVKDFQDNLSAVEDTFDRELADLINSAVIVTETPTLTIEKK
ncbi:hypothetical protein BH20ACI1_BH20ACI1_09920 [soil metagenome]